MSFDSIKLVLVGESGTGKTSIIQQYAYKLFDQDCASSISSQYISKVIQLEEINKSVRIEIWDTAGQERYRFIVSGQTRDFYLLARNDPEKALVQRLLPSHAERGRVGDRDLLEHAAQRGETEHAEAGDVLAADADPDSHARFGTVCFRKHGDIHPGIR